MTREHISHILELRELLLTFQTGFNLVNSAIVCAILESISDLEPSSVITEPRYLKLVTVSSFLDLCVDATGVVCSQLGDSTSPPPPPPKKKMTPLPPQC